MSFSSASPMTSYDNSPANGVYNGFPSTSSTTPQPCAVVQGTATNAVSSPALAHSVPPNEEPTYPESSGPFVYLTTELANQAAADYEKEKFNSILDWYQRNEQRKADDARAVAQRIQQEAAAVEEQARRDAEIQADSSRKAQKRKAESPRVESKKDRLDYEEKPVYLDLGGPPAARTPTLDNPLKKMEQMTHSSVFQSTANINDVVAEPLTKKDERAAKLEKLGGIEKEVTADFLKKQEYAAFQQHQLRQQQAMASSPSHQSPYPGHGMPMPGMHPMPSGMQRMPGMPPMGQMMHPSMMTPGGSMPMMPGMAPGMPMNMMPGMPMMPMMPGPYPGMPGMSPYHPAMYPPMKGMNPAGPMPPFPYPPHPMHMQMSPFFHPGMQQRGPAPTGHPTMLTTQQMQQMAQMQQMKAAGRPSPCPTAPMSQPNPMSMSPFHPGPFSGPQPMAQPMPSPHCAVSNGASSAPSSNQPTGTNSKSPFYPLMTQPMPSPHCANPAPPASANSANMKPSPYFQQMSDSSMLQNGPGSGPGMLMCGSRAGAMSHTMFAEAQPSPSFAPPPNFTSHPGFACDPNLYQAPSCPSQPPSSS